MLNNRPFDHTVAAILTHTADHEVERRLIYIEPDPKEPSLGPPNPGFTTTILEALVKIPAQQPIGDTLVRLAEHSQRALEIRALINAIEPKVQELIAELPKPSGAQIGPMSAPSSSLELDTIEACADAVQDDAAARIGLGYGPYESIKTGEVISKLSNGLGLLLGYQNYSRRLSVLRRIVRHWAERQGLVLGIAPADRKWDEAADLRKKFLKEFRYRVPATSSEVYDPSDGRVVCRAQVAWQS